MPTPRQGAWQQAGSHGAETAVAESLYPHLSTTGRESNLGMTQAFGTSKHPSNDTPPLPILPKLFHQPETKIQTHEPMGAILIQSICIHKHNY